jgi:hypothetical protein
LISILLKKYFFLNIPIVKATLNKGPRWKWIKLWFNLQGIILKRKPIGPDNKTSAYKRAHGLENQNVCQGPRLLIFFVFSPFHCFFYPSCSSVVRMKTSYELKTLYKNKPTPSFWPILKVHMIGFVDPHKVIVKRNPFSTLPSAWHEGDNKKLRKPWKKKGEKRLTSSSHISIPHFLYWTLQFDSKPLDTHSLYLRKKSFFKITFFILNPSIWLQAFRHTLIVP